VHERDVGVRSMFFAESPKFSARVACTAQTERPRDHHPGVTNVGRQPDSVAGHGGTVTEIALEARHLYKVFGKNPQQAVRRLKAGETREQVADAGTAAVIDASFSVRRGEIFVIMGLSGSGKSTVIRMLNGLHEVTD